MSQKPLKLKKFFIMMAIWFVTIISVIIGSIVYQNSKSSLYDDTAIPYLKKVVPILSEWDVEKTKNVMYKPVLDEIPERNFAAVIDLFSTMGALKEMGEPNFDKETSGEDDDGIQQTIVDYKVEATYENGDAKLKIRLLVAEDTYEVYYFNVSSETLAPKTEEKK